MAIRQDFITRGGLPNRPFEISGSLWVLEQHWLEYTFCTCTVSTIQKKGFVCAFSFLIKLLMAEFLIIKKVQEDESRIDKKKWQNNHRAWKSRRRAVFPVRASKKDPKSRSGGHDFSTVTSGPLQNHVYPVRGLIPQQTPSFSVPRRSTRSKKRSKSRSRRFRRRSHRNTNSTRERLSKDSEKANLGFFGILDFLFSDFCCVNDAFRGRKDIVSERDFLETPGAGGGSSKIPKDYNGSVKETAATVEKESKEEPVVVYPIAKYPAKLDCRDLVERRRSSIQERSTFQPVAVRSSKLF